MALSWGARREGLGLLASALPWEEADAGPLRTALMLFAAILVRLTSASSSVMDAPGPAHTHHVSRWQYSCHSCSPSAKGLVCTTPSE